MDRGLPILFILTLFTQAVTGSVMSQFSSAEKKDKTKMLQYLRGMLKLDATTTVKVNVIKREENLIPSTVKPEYLRTLRDRAPSEQIWDRQPSTNKRDKSKMLSYLRGMKGPSKMFNVYEPTTEDSIQRHQNAENNPNTQKGQHLVVTVDKSGESEQQVLWENAGATQVTYLQPAEKDKDSGTCFWRGQQPYLTDLAAYPYGARVSMKQTEPYDIENIGENITAAWECAKKKFWISYDKIKAKVCGMFEG